MPRPARAHSRSGVLAVPYPTRSRRRHRPLLVRVPLSAIALLLGVVQAHGQEEEPDPPEVVVGERLFLETRFAEFYHRSSPEDANRVLGRGDPVMDVTRTTGDDLAGPFKGLSMNCRACHLVDEFVDQKGAGIRTYADYARRSPIPARGDARPTTLRNSPPQVNASLPREFRFFHFDGEFVTMEDLVKGTFTGRNFGWLPAEERVAIAHIAFIIRNDDGMFPFPEEPGGSYAKILKGTDPDIPPELRLPERYRLDVRGPKVSDVEVLDAVARLVAAYVESLEFHRDKASKSYDTSPYDVFLRRNDLPVMPGPGEDDLAYSRRLAKLVEGLESPKFVTPDGRKFKYHDQPFGFGARELEGLKIFLREPAAAPRGRAPASKVGNCIACHAAPNFTDFVFHNTGAAQEEYDSVHGAGSFAAITIPGDPPEARKAGDVSYQQRQDNYRAYLPTQPQHPSSDEGPFASVPSVDRPGHTDLGLWNVFLNPSFPKPQDALLRLLRRAHPGISDPSVLLTKTIAVFKTPGLRDLGHSAPYLHTGRMNGLEDVVRFYGRFSNLMREGKVRNGAPELARVYLSDEDVSPLAAFLRSLNEDYD